MFYFELSHGHADPIFLSHFFFLVESNGLRANDHSAIAEQGGRRDPCLGNDRSGTLASFVAPHNFLDLFSAESRRQAMNLELRRLRRGFS